MHQHPAPNTTPAADGLEVVDATGIITGNADIVCERGEPQPDTVACTLPIYPQPGELPLDPPAHMSLSGLRTAAAESARVARTVAPLEALTRDIDAMVARVHHDFPKAAPGPHTRRVGDREGGAK